MAAGTRRRKKPKPPSLGARDIFRVLDQDGEVMTVKPSAGMALTTAQRKAELYGEPVTLYVERDSLFGPNVELHRVVRDEEGTVFTFIENPED